MDVCDNCGSVEETHVLQLSEQLFAEMCRECWTNEMSWRLSTNALKEKNEQLPVMKWPAEGGYVDHGN